MEDRLKQQKIPIPPSEIFDRKVINPDDPETKAALQEIKTLGLETQRNIYEEIKKQRGLGRISPEEARELFKDLIDKAQKKKLRDIATRKFNAMDGSGSDKSKH